MNGNELLSLPHKQIVKAVDFSNVSCKQCCLINNAAEIVHEKNEAEEESY